MSPMESRSEIVKTSKAGHILTSRQRRQELLAEFDKSGLCAAKFAELIGIKYPTFMYWLQQRRVKPSASSPAVEASGKGSPSLWIETVIQKAHSSALPGTVPQPLLVRLPSGAALEIGHSSHVQLGAALLRAWEKSPC